MQKAPKSIALIREGKLPPDRRVALSPDQCVRFQQTFPNCRLMVQSSPIRCFSDAEYAEKGIEVVELVDEAEVLIGVKEVPIDQLIPSKTYLFFSHTFKKQPYNRGLLRAILEKNIRLIDYELLSAEKGGRLLGFGRYAGVVGAYNGLLGWGKMTGDFQLKPAHQCFDRKEVDEELAKVELPEGFKLVVTGTGRVSSGIQELLLAAGLRRVDAKDFLMSEFPEPVFSVLGPLDYVRRIDGRSFLLSEFFKDPAGFESSFLPFAQTAHVYMSGHYWKEGSPVFFTPEQASADEFSLRLIADISCDIAGPIPSTLRPSTIADPFYGYQASSANEVAFGSPGSIGVMAVDNLPGELPRDASEDFGDDLLAHVLPQFFNADPGTVLQRATETDSGQLTPSFHYLQDYVDDAD